MLVEAVNWLIAPLLHLGWAEPLSVRTLDFTWRAILALTVYDDDDDVFRLYRSHGRRRRRVSALP